MLRIAHILTACCFCLSIAVGCASSSGSTDQLPFDPSPTELTAEQQFESTVAAVVDATLTSQEVEAVARATVSEIVRRDATSIAGTRILVASDFLPTLHEIETVVDAYYRGQGPGYDGYDVVLGPAQCEEFLEDCLDQDGLAAEYWFSVVLNDSYFDHRLADPQDPIPMYFDAECKEWKSVVAARAGIQENRDLNLFVPSQDQVAGLEERGLDPNPRAVEVMEIELQTMGDESYVVRATILNRDLRYEYETYAMFRVGTIHCEYSIENPDWWSPLPDPVMIVDVASAVVAREISK